MVNKIYILYNLIVESKINKELLDLENNDNCIFLGKITPPKKEIKSESNSNHNLNTEDKTNNDFKEIINLTKLVELNNQYNECCTKKNINDVSLKLTNSDFDKKLKNDTSNAVQEKNLIELGDCNNQNQTKQDMMNQTHCENLINLNETLNKKDKNDDLIKINESSIYEEIPEDTNNTLKLDPANNQQDNNLIHEEYKKEGNKINIEKALQTVNSALNKSSKEEFYYNNTSGENIYNLENNKFDLLKEVSNQNHKLEQSISKSENLTFDKSNCESRGFDIINTQEDVLNRSAGEKDIVTSNRCI